MIDMRGSEEDSMLSPHSQVRHELMHNQYNMLKEEEDHWQDVSVFRHLFPVRSSKWIRMCLQSYDCVSGLGQMEESQKECVSGPDQKRRGEENDGETVKWRRRITEKKKHQDVQRNSGGEVCLLYTFHFCFHLLQSNTTDGHGSFQQNHIS